MIQARYFSTSGVEIRDLIKAWIAIILVFTIFLKPELHSYSAAALVSFISVSIGFILHELAHKVVAQHYGCFAEFRAFTGMLALSIILAFFGIIFIAPGAVFISGPVGKRRNGIISAAGPLTNIVLAGIFLVVRSFIDNPITSYGVSINGWLALFNMIPFGPLDGAKIWRWNQFIFGVMAIIALIIVYGVR